MEQVISWFCCKTLHKLDWQSPGCVASPCLAAQTFPDGSQALVVLVNEVIWWPSTTRMGAEVPLDLVLRHVGVTAHPGLPLSSAKKSSSYLNAYGRGQRLHQNSSAQRLPSAWWGGMCGWGSPLSPNDPRPVTAEEPAAAELPPPSPTTASSPPQTVLFSVYASKEDFAKSCHKSM